MAVTYQNEYQPDHKVCSVLTVTKILFPKKGTLGDYLVFATNTQVYSVGGMIDRIPDKYR